MCPFCKQGNAIQVMKVTSPFGTYPVLRCDVCGTEYTPVSSDAIDNEVVQKHFFDEDLYTIANLTAVHRMWREQVREMIRLHPTPGKILDIGCNTGEFLYCVPPLWEKHGIEIADVPANMAAEKGITVHRRPLEECNLPDNSFDVVTLFALIEHLGDPRSLLKEISRILKPGGMMVLMTGDCRTWKARLLGAKWHMYIPPLHQFYFHRGSLCKVSAEFGMNEVDHYYSCGGMTFFNNKLMKLAEKASLWQVFNIPGIRRIPFYDHYYGYFVKGTRG